MADITAANVEKEAYNIVGNLAMVIYKVTGDGSGVTIPTHVGKVIAAWISNTTETAGYSPQLSWATNIVTYGAAPSSTKIHRLFVLGRP